MDRSQPLSSPSAGEPEVAAPPQAEARDDAAGHDATVPYFNRELSWLEFNRRVLAQALDERTPLLERVFFLSIFTSNLDEFYMKRVGGLKRQLVAGVGKTSIDGLTPGEQIAAIRATVTPMIQQQATCFDAELRPKLREDGIHLLLWHELDEADLAYANEYFRTQVFPVLTPLTVDMGHPFPFISNLSYSLAFLISHPGSTERLFARVKIPEVIPRWIRIQTNTGDGPERYFNLVELVRHNAHELFFGMEIIAATPFRITRNADIEHDAEDAEDLLDAVSGSLRARRFANVVRLEHGADPDPRILRFLKEELELGDEDLYELPGGLDHTGLSMVSRIARPEHHFTPWSPRTPPRLVDEDAEIFATIRQGDLLVHHPYESFNASVERFIRTAADDPRVLAIKMTLYRTGDQSPFVNTLVRAAEAGKQVVCMVELQARFDEQRNIQCAQLLENAGVHVVYGIVGLKTHTKTALVVRDDPDGLRCYAHIGTGNYHSGTARLYTDLGLLTANREITQDMVELFHYITGRSVKRNYRHLLVAPVNMRDRFMEMIEREIEHHKAGRPAHVFAKMNSLEDRRIIEALYDASNAGVPIDLIVRGFCCLRAGVPGMSENIRVMSVIGRFLEHARIYHFRNGAEDPVDGEYYIGSADWMYRNLSRRVEAITPIVDRTCKSRLWEILQVQADDQRQAWDLQPDGQYIQRMPNADDPASHEGTHNAMMRLTIERHGKELINPGSR